MKFKMPTAYSIIFIFIVIVAVLTWIIPAGQFDDNGVFQLIDQSPQGLWHIFAGGINGFYDGIDIALFVLVLGGFINIVIQSGAMERGIAAITKSSRGREEILIIILMILFGIGGSTYGMAEETIAFYLVVIPAFLLAGYDVLVPVMVILLGAGVGVLASTVNPFATGAASDAAGVALGDGIIHRLIMFVVLEAVAIIYVIAYARKVKKDPSASVVADLHKEHLEVFEKEMGGKDGQDMTLTGRDKMILALMGLTFFWMVFTLIPWEDFGITIFYDISQVFINIPIFGFAPTGSPVDLASICIDCTADALEKIEGLLKPTNSPADFAAIGEWYFAQLSTWFLIMSIVIGAASGIGEKNTVKYFVEGAKDILEVSLIVALARGISVVLGDGSVTDTILYYASEAIANLPGMLFLIFNYLLHIALSFLIPSTSGLAAATMPIVGPLGDIQGVGAPAVITAYQSASGIVNLMTPTSGVVMGALAIAHVPYPRWVAFITPFLGIMFALTIVFLVIISTGII